MKRRDDEAQLQLQLLTDNLPGMWIAYDRDLRCVFANRRFAETYGFSLETILGKHLREVIGDGPYREVESHYERVLAGHRVTYERRRVLNDGEERLLEVELIPHLTSNGKSCGLFAITNDVTERRRAEIQRQASEEKFSKAFHASPDWVALSKLVSGEFLEVNEGYELISGYSRAESIGRSVLALDIWVDPAHRLRLVERLVAGERVRDVETTFRSKDGTQRLIQVSMETIDLSGEQCLLTVGRDITTRKRNEQLRLLGHQVAELIAGADSSSAAVQSVIRMICESEGWDCGRYFVVARPGEALRLAEAWGIDDPVVREIIQRSKELEFPFGKGLVGAVWESGQPVWVAERSTDPRTLHRVFRDRSAAGGIFLFPVRAQGRVVGVLAFDSRERRNPDALLLQSIVDIGAQIGQFLQRKQVEEHLREREAELADAQRTTQAVIEALPNPVYFKDTDGRYLGVNKAWETFFGVPREVFLGKTVRDLYSDDSQLADRLRADDQLLWDKPETPRTHEESITTADGKRHEAIYYKATFQRADGAVAGLVGTIVDITDRKRLERRQVMEHEVTRLLAEFTSLEDVMPKLFQVLGKSLGCVCGTLRIWREAEQNFICAESWHVPSAQLAAFIAVNTTPRPAPTQKKGLIGRAILGGEPWWIADVSLEPNFNRAATAKAAGLRGALAFPIYYGEEKLGVMEFFSREVLALEDMQVQSMRDIGSQIGQFLARREAEQRVLHLAHFDELTDLPNRSLFNERLSHALVRARRVNEHLAIFFIDLDRFKNINDTFGHGIGDLVLVEIAQRLRACLREVDTISRFGGDEFLVLIEGGTGTLNFVEVAQKILAAVARPVVVEAQEFHLTASIGISTFPEDGDDLQGLVKNADIAMYRAKDLGKNTHQFYSAAINVHTLEHVALESALRHALHRNEFVLHYQPKVDIATQRIIGMEALVRWQPPGKAIVAPLTFIPLAEETGLIVPIGEWVLKTACAQNKAWQDLGLAPLRIAVNLSKRQFTHETLLQDLRRVLHESALDPAWLEFEITESMVMHDPERSVNVLREMKAMGIHLSIDDFGTGYSSLAYLKRFPLDSLKIDSAFIQDLPGDADDAAITQAIVAMAHSLRLGVVAEGVETEAQLRFLRDNGCDEMQGYYFSKALPAEQFLHLLREKVIGANREP